MRISHFILILFLGLSYCVDVLPVVSGTFYPNDPKLLQADISKYLEKANPPPCPYEYVQAIIVPHAGYDYSAQIAAFAYKQASKHAYKTIILVGPSHYVNRNTLSVYPQGVFKTPVGDLRVNEKLTERILAENPKLSFDQDGYAREHSLEVQLPFIKTLWPEAQIVPIIIESQTLENSELLARILAKYIDKDTLLVISTDLSHYHDYKTAIDMDNLAQQCILNSNTQGLFDGLVAGKLELCGYGGVLSLMMMAKQLRFEGPVLLKQANSGDVTNQKDRVVGYASYAYGPAHQASMYSKDEQNFLLNAARNSIKQRFNIPIITTESDCPQHLKERNGVFVTLKKDNQLRGCIGNVLGETSIYEDTKRLAIASAFEDTRFPPLNKDEVSQIKIEISIMTIPTKIEPENIVVGKHGLIIRKDDHQGLLLPQVPLEWGWDKTQYLDALCTKAGLPRGSWKDAELYGFEAIVFGE